MQKLSSSTTKAPAPQIPSHVIERMESEWRQIRQGTSRPASASAK
ncbi:hypothetical protein [Rhizobium halophytocola]|uniref:Uncharacterized protein n=1 Tax=Rhizobium halophytocola TaxID=735519 RepID=A0ABS4E5J3_9HYPH|nr:hypothetical protein [Rhizobium halophytocola]MBP1853220.1 hypothetical protein [Rhizobium halophytocola]